MNQFKAGEYIVLLNTCLENDKTLWEQSLPCDYVYLLKENFNTYRFYPDKDLKGSRSNGWSLIEASSPHTFMRAREATENEILNYKLYDKPCPADKEGENAPIIVNESLKELLIKYNIN